MRSCKFLSGDPTDIKTPVTPVPTPQPQQQSAPPPPQQKQQKEKAESKCQQEEEKAKRDQQQMPDSPPKQPPKRLRQRTIAMTQDSSPKQTKPNTGGKVSRRQQQKMEKEKQRLEVERIRLNKIDPGCYAVPEQDLAKDHDLPLLRPPLSREEWQQVKQQDLTFMIREVEQYKNQMWLFGVTENGRSVSVQVGFQPWFFVQSTNANKNPSQELDALKSKLNSVYKHKYAQEKVVSLSFEDRQELVGFNHERKTRVIRVVCSSPQAYRHYLHIFKTQLDTTYNCFNEEMPLRVMFLAAIQATMYGWITIKPQHLAWNDLTPEDELKMVQSQDPSSGNNNNKNDKKKNWEAKKLKKKITTSQIEAVCAVSASIVALPETEHIAPLLRVVFDIETVSATSAKHKPHPANRGDLIICISNIFYRYGQKEPVASVVMCLGQTESIAAALALEKKQENETVQTLCYADEKEMLKAWHRMIFTNSDIDEILGYNSMYYDTPYFHERAKMLRLEELSHMSKFRDLAVQPQMKKSSSAQRGDDVFIVLDMLGRTQFDVFRVVRKEKKLSSYKLRDVVNALLLKGLPVEEQKRLGKIDLPYESLRPYFMADAKKRQEIGLYCLRDSEITMRLATQNQFCENYMQMAKLCHTSNMQLMTAGEAIKVWNYASRKIEGDGWILCKQDLENLTKAYPLSFAGGKVLDARKGFYKVPVSTFDFSSLYPSIFLAWNMDYSTLLFDPEKIAAARLAGYDVQEIDLGAKYNPHFVQGVRSLLPDMLKTLLAARKVAQNQMKNTTDAILRGVLNAKQSALKITCNSVYGFTGAGAVDGKKNRKTKKQREKEAMMPEDPNEAWKNKKGGGGGFLTCVAIASSVCATGRKMIGQVADEIVKLGGEVLYGDTDSVMCVLPEAKTLCIPKNPNAGELEALNQFMRNCDKMAEGISALFKKPINLAFEKCASRYLSLGKKKYSMIVWELEGGKAVCRGIKCRGLESVRRDWCPLSTKMGTKLVEMVMNDADFGTLTAEFQKTVVALEQNQVPLEDFRLTKALKANYANDKVMHYQVAKKIAERDPARALLPGERVQYVVIDNGKPAHLKGEDFDYAKQHNIVPDRLWYFEKQLLVPSARIATALDPAAEEKWNLLGGGLRRIATKTHAITDFFHKR